MAKIIDGKVLAEGVLSNVRQRFQDLGRPVTLAIIRIGDDSASIVYIRNKKLVAKKLGIAVKSFCLPKTTKSDEAASLIDGLNADENVDGILLQLPLPNHLAPRKLIDRIFPEKDVDGLTLVNQGKLFINDSSGMRPCTPTGIMHMIKSAGQDISGMHAIVLGRSQIVGKPLVQMLLQENCTVTNAHSYSQDLPGVCRNGDIVISAVGKPQFVQADWIKEGAIVIDVGINRDKHNKIVGDVDFLSISRIARAISPVPGGAGPMTVAYLMHNVAEAATKQQRQK
ncbi:MAG: bifunctional 5,10-methylenetetrahydrofolate dehydrogenase/5,10-methenyltetrahydrofolate cyclohydrolase [Holosporales bacterium]|jgi:methylenetetrahydrofolate dehydrogenase (NADP+)/methenyltetrahydrofolate cyclohydrolase|nr:bifunctional 5,10-methylenetetrahydrofolate dehydrogenase/5,10-methenyltetrahydrofolate cyclohydrolase [Holosporales bacterium]